MRRGLVGDEVGGDAAAHELGVDVGGVAEQADAQGPLRGHGLSGQAQRLVERLGGDVEIGRLEAAPDAVRVDLDAERHAAGHGDGQRLGAAHAAEAGRQDEAAGQVGAVVLLAGGREGLVGALEDALRADVDPDAGGHLPVHRQAQGVQAPELVPVGPVGHQVGVGDEHPWGHLVGLEDAHGLAALHEQRLVVLEAAQGGDDGVEARPVARRLAGAAVDDELLRRLGDLGVEIVHEHAQGGFLLPALAADLRAAGGTDHPGAAWSPAALRLILSRHRLSFDPSRDPAQATIFLQRITAPGASEA